MEQPVLHVQGLSKQYKRFKIGPLDFKLEQGLITGLVGANGSGKSTLLQLLMNIRKADAGEIFVFGEHWKQQDTKWKEEVGYAGELLDAYGFLRIVELKQLISRWYANWNEGLFQYLIKRYQIDLDEKFEKCSKGTKKKLNLFFLYPTTRSCLCWMNRLPGLI